MRKSLTIIIIIILLVMITSAYSSFADNVLYGDVNLSVTTSRNLIPPGGNQSIQIKAQVTQGNDLPIEGVTISFFAQTNNNDRNEQISMNEVVTDKNGLATSTYTTLAEDDNEHLILTVNARINDDYWIEKNAYPLASDKASQCEGQIINPFTGEPHSNTSISIFNMDTEYYFLFEGEVDENGFYSFALNPGNYHIRFHLDLGDANYYSDSYSGSHSLVKDDNTVELRIGKVIENNKNYSFNSETGIIKGKITNMDSSNELYITGKGGRDTVIANINPDGNFMILLQEGIYEISDRGGHIIKQNVKIENGNVNDLGSFSR